VISIKSSPRKSSSNIPDIKMDKFIKDFKSQGIASAAAQNTAQKRMNKIKGFKPDYNSDPNLFI